MKGITVNELCSSCKRLIKDGYGNKVVLLSDDDEGNGFHTLYYLFSTDKETIKECADMFHDRNNAEDVVLLG